MAQNICKCPTPPGGSVVCEPNQMAICRVRNGEVETSCIDPPADVIDDQQAFENWALQTITEEYRLMTAPITPRERAILKSGRYDKAPTILVRFRLPLSVGGGGVLLTDITSPYDKAGGKKRKERTDESEMTPA